MHVPSLSDVEELSDPTDAFQFVTDAFPDVGYLPRAIDTYPNIEVGRFYFTGEAEASYEASYLLTFEDGTEVLANLSTAANSVPEPRSSLGVLIGVLSAFVLRRKRRQL